MNLIRHRTVWTTLLALLALGAGGDALAAVTGTVMPWEAPLTKIVTAMTGTTAFAISVIALVLGLGTLAFTDQLSGAGRYLVYITIVIGSLVAVVNLLSNLFSVAASTGAMPSTVQLGIGIVVLALGAALAVAERALWFAWRERRAAARRPARTR